MSYQILDGKHISQNLFDRYQKLMEYLKTNHQIVPKLVVVKVGDNPAGEVYVRQKEKKAHTIGMGFDLIRLPEDVSQKELLEQIHRLNQDTQVHGIIIQAPLPDHLDPATVENHLNYQKDAEGVHPFNLGKVAEGSELIVPCTPKGIVALLDAYQVPTHGRHVCIIGNSTVVGLPLALMMMNRDATVTSCNKATGDLVPYTKDADIVVVAAGVIDLIGPDHIKPGAVVVDVGININEQGKIVGDVSFDLVKEKTSYISTVPGGIGPMTVAMSIEQTIRCACSQNKLNFEQLIKEVTG
ncbi:bifunctional 5,10-methylenetetrahydrofolate dehydrogenase/5,10-methenyltetrahydrofolate cyclohydrolase [Vaginisenegalia massiliensis]|uniref:bifunctional 5,10-methylenetetrahydrofolate dehydrogenase/5,10-methenyltetrahydrofolate cyclohydrolase n=1 Tax=Vaginisenegalia massiliensis TaxID=2058294 RepID=UPI000F51B032|nr:bifunctional 5,10-methylenetetrahydrofolate dehydrogenase/5,10-methenyltetrahydrofolate cyclohydrolase [Vaginisenegalia massiliensis]